MITLAQAKAGMSNKVDQMVIDEFRRGSYLLDSLVFDNAVSPGTGGSTLGYSYIKLKTPSTAAFRAINTDYANVEAIREAMSTECKIFGGSFKLDRVIINTSGAVDELQFQMQEKVKGATNLFHYCVINGDKTARPTEFDGLDVLLTGSSTEYIPSAPIDLSTSVMIKANGMEFSDMMNEFIYGMEDAPDMLLVNGLLKVKMISVAQSMGYYTRSEGAFGAPADKWNGIPIIDLKSWFDPLANKSVPVVPVDATAKTTSMYAVKIAMDGFHGISPTGTGIISTAMPDLDGPGALKTGDVEMVAGVVLKNSLKAGVFRDIKVA